LAEASRRFREVHENRMASTIDVILDTRASREGSIRRSTTERGTTGRRVRLLATAAAMCGVYWQRFEPMESRDGR
jgi:hypothetical protein